MEETVDWKGFRAYSWNIPRRRAGVYTVTHIVSEKVYVGVSINVYDRTHVHSRKTHSIRLLRAIVKYGKAAFLVTPVYYSVVRNDFLEEIEAKLIRTHDSVRNGYNIIEAHGGVGPYGPAFGAILAAKWKDPVTRARHEAVWSNLEWKKKQGDIVRTALSQPEANARLRAAHVNRWNDQGRRDRQSELRRTGTNISTYYSAAGSQWITNGISEQQRVEITGPLPEGWRYGRLQWSEATRTAITQSIAWMKGAVTVTDGNQTRYLRKGESIPEGWRFGKTYANAEAYTRSVANLNHTGKIWINDGSRHRRVVPDVVIPEGWVEGKLPWKKNAYRASGKKRVWITDGTNNAGISKGDPLPEGWRLGRTLRKRN